MDSIALKDYYNKLVQVHLSAKIAEALNAEVYHHLGNGASTLHGFLRLTQGGKDPVHEAHFLNQARAITDKVGNEARDMMKPLIDDMAALDIVTLPLTKLIENPQVMTKESFDALSAFNDRLMTAADDFRNLRQDAEEQLLRASGLVSPDFNVAAEPDLRRYYRKLVQVQLSVKIAHALFSELTYHFGMVPEAMELMEPITQETLRQNITALRLHDLVTKPGIITKENFDALSAFNDQLRTISRSFRDIRARAEVRSLKERGLIPADFTI